ncbi:MAG: hypothetical protein HDR06_04465 [Lachnospiraceae bacterium]|nr:hypothetical protein [Lachnospiraceae bacterium]
MTEKTDYLTNKLFGTSSEKTKNLEGQYNLFDEAEQEAIPNDESAAAESVPAKEHTRKAKSRQSDIFKGVPSRDEPIPFYDYLHRELSKLVPWNETVQEICSGTM